METPATPSGLVIRDALAADAGVIMRLIRALAVYEKLEHEVVATEESMRDALFTRPAKAHALLCEIGGKAVGFAVWFYNFSTFLGRPGMYLEDLYVEPEFRKRGIGAAVFKHLAARAVKEGCGRFEWAVLNWNEPAIKFYERMGSVAMSEWHVRRLSGNNLKKLAA
ncbi:MAG: GNAT family N-acetyltransferase [Rhodospirillaceae bacterium]|nr:GNAT family N-acetyltransferase [Rhodospirillaceae bacterium]